MRMKKNRWIFSVMLLSLLLMVLAPAARAASSSGSCGDGLTWTLENYTLTISGSGEMEDGRLWEDYKTKIEHVVLTGGVTKIGTENFYGCDRLETVDFGDALVEIGTKAFYDCEDITYLHLPQTFRTFGAQSFRGCDSLKAVYCEGGMPRFNDSCLWTGNYISVFYPSTNPWPTEHTSQLINSYGGHLGIMMGTFDPENLPKSDLQAAEETEEETEESTEETESTQAAVAAIAQTEPAATQPETVPATVPETEPTTVPTTEPETEPTTEATTEEISEETTEETTEAATEETEPVDPVRKVGGDGWIGMVIIAGVLTMLLAGAMIFRGISRRGNRY